MNTEIGKTYTKEDLKGKNFRLLANALNSMGDRSLRANGDGTYTVEKNKIHIETEAELAEREIFALKEYLTSTDYTVIKSLELGLSPSDAYPEIHQKRTEARERINTLEEKYGINN